MNRTDKRQVEVWKIFFSKKNSEEVSALDPLLYEDTIESAFEDVTSTLEDGWALAVAARHAVCQFRLRHPRLLPLSLFQNFFFSWI